LSAIDEQSPSVAGKKCKLERKLSNQSGSNNLLQLTLQFTKDDLNGYLTLRAAGLSRKTITWLKKSADLLWNATRGAITVSTIRSLRDTAISKYTDNDAKRKVLQFARAFLRYLTKISFDQRFAAFELFLQLPKSVKEQKRVTTRIVTKNDIQKPAFCHQVVTPKR